MRNVNFTFPGGMPLDQQVLDYLQTAYTEQVQAINKFALLADLNTATAWFMTDHGLAYSGSSWSHQDCWVMWNGTAVLVPARTFAGSAGPDAWRIEIYSENGPSLTYRDGAARFPFTELKGRIYVYDPDVAPPPVSAAISYVDAATQTVRLNYLFERLRNRILAPIDSWHVVGTTGQPAYGAGWVGGAVNGYASVRFRGELVSSTNTVVRLAGSAGISNASAGSQPVFVLPAGYRPAARIRCGCHLRDLDTNTNGAGFAEILPTGQIFISRATASLAFPADLNTVIYLDGICFPTD